MNRHPIAELVGYPPLDGERLALREATAVLTFPQFIRLPGSTGLLLGMMAFRRRVDEPGPDGQLYYDFENIFF